MDLGLQGKQALVCGASQGLGFACARALAAEGVRVWLVARRQEPLQAAATLLKSEGALVHVISADVTREEGREKIRQSCPETDILVTNAGGPAPGDFRDWDRDDWISAIDANMLTPIALIQAYVDGMMARGFGRIVNITSSSVKSPLESLGLSTGARSGLTGFVGGLARSVVSRGVTINNVLPGTFATARLEGNFSAQARREGRSVEEVIESRLSKHPAKRFGHPDELGKTCAFLCSVHAGYINGQNILLDGGSFPGVL